MVADEVRNLASRTRQATDEISGMIHSIQQETGNAISTMETVESVNGMPLLSAARAA